MMIQLQIEAARKPGGRASLTTTELVQTLDEAWSTLARRVAHYNEQGLSLRWEFVPLAAVDSPGERSQQDPQLLGETLARGGVAYQPLLARLTRFLRVVAVSAQRTRALLAEPGDALTEDRRNRLLGAQRAYDAMQARLLATEQSILTTEAREQRLLLALKQCSAMVDYLRVRLPRVTGSHQERPIPAADVRRGWQVKAAGDLLQGLHRVLICEGRENVTWLKARRGGRVPAEQIQVRVLALRRTRAVVEPLPGGVGSGKVSVSLGSLRVRLDGVPHRCSDCGGQDAYLWCVQCGWPVCSSCGSAPDSLTPPADERLPGVLCAVCFPIRDQRC